MTKVVYCSITGQVEKLVSRLTNMSKIKLSDNSINVVPLIEPFILILPSYEDFPLADVVKDFMDMNHKMCIGIIGSGNLNFANLFMCTAHEFADRYNVPIIMGVEFAGSDLDINSINNIISLINDMIPIGTKVLISVSEPEYCMKNGKVGTVIGMQSDGTHNVIFDDNVIMYFLRYELSIAE